MDVGLKFCRDNPDKKDGYITYRSLTIEAEKKFGLVKVSGETLGNVWPFTLFSNPGPLKVLYNKRLEQENPNIVRIRVPNSQTGESLLKVKSQNEINRYIIENLASARELTLIGRADVEFLFYLRPEITSDKLDELALTNSNIKQKIVVSKIYGISPRGDRVLVTADEAKKLKYHNVCYELSPSNVEVPIKCTVLVDRTQVVFGINKNYDVVEFPTGAELEVEAKKRAFLDYFILSHLYELQCSERIQHGSDRQGVSRESEFRDRRAHLRRLPQGQKPSADAIGRANQDPNRFNLIEINRMNDIAGNSSQTYVSPVHKPAPGDQPLLSYAPNAFDTFRSIITK